MPQAPRCATSRDHGTAPAGAIRPILGDVPDDCLFCRIVSGDLPATVIWEDDHTIVFRDIEPQAPTHVLVIPREHQPNAAASTQANPAVTSALVAAAAAVAEQEGLDGNYRMVFNTGSGAGQSVFHTHLHVLGGRDLTWPPG